VRWKNEEVRINGISAFFYAAIPWILLMAALAGLAFWTGVVSFSHDQQVQTRMDNRVGVVEPLKKPVSLIIEDRGCLKITKAFLDGDRLTSYVTDTCPGHMTYWELGWKIKSPDGTIVASGYNNTAELPNLDHGDKIEHVDNLPSDDRSNTVIVWTRAHGE